MVQRMKYLVIVGDGMADYPVEGLNGKTPLMMARTPNMDWLAKHGRVGVVKTIPDGFNPGSERLPTFLSLAMTLSNTIQGEVL